MSEWLGRMDIMARAVDNTPANRQIYGAIFADHGSLETQENESKGLDAVVRYSVSGDPANPVQVFGVSTLIKPAMWGPLKLFLNSLADARWFVSANVDLTYQNAAYKAGQLVETNSAFVTVGQPFDRDHALATVNAERVAGLKAPLKLIQEINLTDDLESGGGEIVRP